MKNNVSLPTSHGVIPNRNAARRWAAFRYLLLSLVLGLGLAQPARATHYRYGSLTWQTVASDATGRTIKFKVSQAFRENYPWPSGAPVVGSIENTGNLSFGDATAAPILLVVTSVNVSDNSFFGEVEITHTYASVGTFTAFFTGGNRLSPPLQNNADQSWYVKTDVTTGSMNNSPVSNLPAVVNLAINQPAAAFTVPGSDAQPLTFSLATPADLAVSFINAPGLTITPSGMATFSTVGKAIGNYYNAIVKISDGSTTIMVDFLIRIVGPSASPYFDYSAGFTPANSSTITVVANHNVSFVVKALDPDVSDAVALAGNGLPPGSSFGSPAPANPVQGTFSWTPTAAALGPHVVSFTAQDPVGVQAITSVTINVILCNMSLSTAVTNVNCHGKSNGSIDLTVVNGTGPFFYAWTGPGSYASTTEDPTGLAAGTYTVVVTDQNGCTETTSAAVNEPPLELPQITCPANITTPSTVCGAYVTYTAPVGTHSCRSVSTALTSGPASGAFFPLGSTTVAYTVTDDAGNSASCSFTVMVSGSVATTSIAVTKSSSVYTGVGPNTLVLSYGAQTATLTASGSAGSTYAWAPATGLSNPGIANPVFTPIAAGTYPFTVTVTNEFGCTATASVTITVIEARCGNKNDKVLVCHNGHEICISPNAVDTHLTGHPGDALGSCSSTHRPVASGTGPTELSVYPNPAAEQATVSFRMPAAGTAQLRIYNQLGQLVATVFEGTVPTGELRTFALDSHLLAAGVYQCRLVTSSATETTRLVIEK